MRSNMDFRLILTKNADIIISNNQNIAKADCTDVPLQTFLQLILKHWCQFGATFGVNLGM